MFSENNIRSWYAQGLLHGLLDPQDFGHVVTQFVSPKTGQTLKKKKEADVNFRIVQKLRSWVEVRGENSVHFSLF